MLTLSSLNLKNSSINTNTKSKTRYQPFSLIKLQSQPKDLVSFSGFGLPSRKIRNIVEPATIQKRISAFERLFGVSIECQEKSSLYEHGSHFQSEQKYSLIDIQKIYQRAHTMLKEEEHKLKSFNSEDQLGEFANALYEYELKSQYRGKKHRGFKIEYPPVNLINKVLNFNKKKNNIKKHFTFHSLNPQHQEIYKEGLVHQSFISKEMVEIIAQKAKTKSLEVIHNNETYKLSQSGDAIQVLKIS